MEQNSRPREAKPTAPVRRTLSLRWDKLLPVFLVALGVFPYLNALTAPFLFDDFPSIVHRPSMLRLRPIDLTDRWLVDLTFRLNYALSGFNPTDFRAVNVGIHLGAGLLLFGIVKHLLKLPRWSGRWDPMAPWAAATVAALWLAHPLQTESVTYLCQRYESMMGAALLASFYTFVRGVTGGSSRAWLDTSLAIALLGTGTKASMGVAPLLILACDGMVVCGSFREAWRSRWKYHTAMLLTIGLLGCLVFRGLAWAREHHIEAIPSLSPARYLAAQTGVILHYLRLVIVPWPLCLDYAWPLPQGWQAVVLPATVLGTLLTLTVVAALRRHPAAFLGTWFFLNLAPTSSLLPLHDLAAERRMYLALAAPIALGVLGVLWVLERPTDQRSGARSAVRARALGGAFMVYAGLATLTILRHRDYRSADAMWQSVLKINPDNYRQRTALISTLLDQERWGEAEHQIRELLARTSSAMATGLARGIWASDPVFFHAVARNQAGRLCLARGQFEAAIREFRKAVNLRPADKTALHNLALACHLAGRNDEAREVCERLLAEFPNYPSAHALRARMAWEAGAWQDAVAHLRRAVELSPTALGPRCDLAWLLATCPDATVRNGREALEHAGVVVRETQGRSVRALDVLAAAQAETGDFAQAAATAQRALQLARRKAAPDTKAGTEPCPVSEQTGLTHEVQALEVRLAGYRAGRPFRLSPSPPPSPRSHD